MINADATMGRIGRECDDCNEDGTDKDGIIDDSDTTILAIILDHNAANAPANDDGEEDDQPKEGGAIDVRKKRGKTPRKRRRKGWRERAWCGGGKMCPTLFRNYF